MIYNNQVSCLFKGLSRIILKYLILIFVISFTLFLTSRRIEAIEMSPGLNKTRFPNGLSAILKKSARSPVVAIQIWVKAGSSYESREEEWGITHLIEHMIFKGTPTRGQEEIAGAIEAVGGAINAYTSLDYTVYHCVVPKQYWRSALSILSDAIQHAKFDPQELEREKKVVLEEIRMRDDQPQSRLSRLVMKNAYGEDHPYGHPVIGYPDTVAQFVRDDLKRYVKRRYTPENMAVIVVGDVDGAELFPAIQEEFKASGNEEKTVTAIRSINSSEPPPSEADLSAGEAEDISKRLPRGITFNIETMDTMEGYVSVAFRGAPSFSDNDTPFYDILGALLSSGESSRLVRQLRNRLGLVHSIDAYAFTPRLSGLFEVNMAVSPEKIEPALSRLFQELFRLVNEGVIDDELERAKIAVEKDFVYGRERMEGEARKLGVFEFLAGSPQKINDYLEKVRNATKEDIRRVAEKIFLNKDITVAMVLPRGNEGVMSGEQLSVLLQETELETLGFSSNMDIERARIVRRLQLPNGLTVLVKEVSDVPTVSIRLAFPGGLRYETPDNNGVFHFLASCWSKGTEFHSAEGLAELIDGIGGGIGGFSGRNTFGLSGQFLSKNLEKGLSLFTEILTTPTFPQEEVEKLRPIILSQIRRQEDYLPSVAMKAFSRLLFSPHPYSMDTLGTNENVRSFSSKDLKKIYNSYAIPSRGVLSIVGDVDTDALISALENMLGAWRREGKEILPELPAPKPLIRPRVSNITREDKGQTHIALGFYGSPIDGQDRYAMEVISAVLSGMGGRLFQALREKEALAYHTTSIFTPGLDYGSFVLYIACSPEKKEKALKGLWREVYRLMSEPISQEEIDRAKKWLIGRHEIGLQTNSSQAMDMALNELYGLGYNFDIKYVQAISKVTPKMCLDTARKYLSQDSYVLITVGP